MIDEMLLGVNFKENCPDIRNLKIVNMTADVKEVKREHAMNLIQNSKLVIGNDTGPTHMAWALNVPSITIFGPTPTSRVYQTAINKTIKSNSFVDPHKLNKNDFSIREIDEMEIVKIAKKLLGIKN